MYGQIYKIEIDNPQSIHDGCYYIGQHKGNVIHDKYYGSGVEIQLYREYWGLQGMRISILAEAESLEELNDLEARYVTKETLQDPRCMNHVTGGRMRKEFSPEVIEILRQYGSIGGKKRNTVEQRELSSIVLKKWHELRKQNEEFDAEWRASCATKNHGFSNEAYYSLLISLSKMIRNDLKKKNVKRYDLLVEKLKILSSTLGGEDERVKNLEKLLHELYLLKE